MRALRFSIFGSGVFLSMAAGAHEGLSRDRGSDYKELCKQRLYTCRGFRCLGTQDTVHAFFFYAYVHTMHTRGQLEQ